MAKESAVAKQRIKISIHLGLPSKPLLLTDAKWFGSEQGVLFTEGRSRA